MMTLEELGYTQEIESQRKAQGLESFDVGRVIAEHKERYLIHDGNHELEGEIIGNLRFTATTRADFPAVGDWVAISPYDEGKVLIHAIIPRENVLERQAVGKSSDVQIIASNIDYGCIALSIDRDFSINRVERYLTICHDARISPIIVITKIDLITKEQLTELTDLIKSRIAEVPIIPLSSVDGRGYNELKALIVKGKTYCLLGSSGVGKSTLINQLANNELMQTGEISEQTDRGKHVTTHRQIVILENGGILIDNPGMREVGITSMEAGLEVTFDDIYELAKDCKYKDCTHTQEDGCAVLKALNEGLLDENSYENYLKMEKERKHFETSAADKKRNDKIFGKVIKNMKKDYKKF